MPPRRTNSTILVGVQRRASETLGRIIINQADADAVKSIKQGYLQETPLPRNKAFSLLNKMETLGLIPKGRYKVRTFKEDGKRKVAIVHEGEAMQVSGNVSIHRKPTRSDAVAYIRKQENLRYDMGGLSKALVDHEVDPNTETNLYHTIRNLSSEARELIVSEQGGKFTVERVGHRKFYSWSKE